MSRDPRSTTAESLAVTAAPARRVLPIWLMGMTTASYGMIGGVMLITTPQLLAAVGTPEPQIAWVIGLSLIPGSIAFLLSPMLDIRLKRRTWAIMCSVVSALLLLAALLSLKTLPLLAALLFLSNFTATLFLGAQTGWLGELVAPKDHSRLAAWSTVGNLGGGGLIAMLAIPMLRSLPFAVGAVILCVITIAPILPFAWLPAPPPDPRLSKESWRAFFRDVAGLVRRPEILRILAMFACPAAAFTLTYTLGGLGSGFGASEQFVAVVGGGGVLFGAVFGSLIVPPLADHISPKRLYLLIGSIGAFFTVGQVFLPRTPVTFALGMIGENAFQSAAFATAFTISFRSLGADNPLAATQMSLLGAASTLPIAYMQVLDGHAYGLGGVAGAYLCDSLVSLVSCAVFYMLVRRWGDAPAKAPPLQSVPSP